MVAVSSISSLVGAITVGTHEIPAAQINNKGRVTRHQKRAMKHILLNGNNWKTTDDFYDAFLGAVGAPTWHGRNFNALRDSITAGRINDVELPYTIQISGTAEMPAEVRSLVQDFCTLIKEFRSEGYDVDAFCEQ
jgi:RNAse (barnase) inhibitor barstar